VTVFEKGDCVVAVQEIQRLDVPRIAASVVFLVFCWSMVLCVIFVLCKVKSSM
jgi:hypothetical protein